jgi:hypothetical protein
VAGSTTDNTITTSFNEVTNNTVSRVSNFNELEGDEIQGIADEQVPLAVVLDDDHTAANVGDEDLTTIEDEETPLAISKSGLAGRVWWYWILIIISALAGKRAKDKKEAKTEAVRAENEK